jgi:polysaccharide deacetylase family protein (PEP-CTERM system associated)
VGELDAPVNVLTVDVEEYYHGHEFTDVLGRDGVKILPSRVVSETERMLDLLDAHRARATFFTLGSVAQRFPRLVREIAARGHELASHGWDHTPVYALGRDRFRADIRRTRQVLEQIGGRSVGGYRAPNYSIRRDTPWAWSVLFEEGYRYDSSVHPIVHDRYGFPEAPRFPYVVARLGDVPFWEVPVGTARLLGFNVPVGGGFFRLFPAALLESAIEAVNRRERRPVVLYVHPWEFDPDQPRPATMSSRQRFRHYVGLRSAEAKLSRLLSRFTFTSVVGAFRDLTAPRELGHASLAS